MIKINNIKISLGNLFLLSVALMAISFSISLLLTRDWGYALNQGLIFMLSLGWASESIIRDSQ
jgi:hypothetical protein